MKEYWGPGYRGKEILHLHPEYLNSDKEETPLPTEKDTVLETCLLQYKLFQISYKSYKPAFCYEQHSLRISCKVKLYELCWKWRGDFT
jgi:hypothetical protein